MTERLLVDWSATSKCVEYRLVTAWIWEDVAIWRSSRSSRATWSLEFYRWGFRITTPLIGCSMGVWL